MNNDSFKPVIIERNGSRIMFIICSFFCLAWWWFLYSITKSYISFKQITFLEYSILVVALIGSIPVFIGVRQVYHERIKITTENVSYQKKGWFRLSKKWEEPFSNYVGISTKKETGISSSGVDMSVETDIFSVIFVHKKNAKKNIILEGNAENKKVQEKIQENYAKIFNLPLK